MKEFVMMLHDDSKPSSAKFTCSSCDGICYFPQPSHAKNRAVTIGYKYCPNCGRRILPRGKHRENENALHEKHKEIMRECESVDGVCAMCTKKEECRVNSKAILSHCGYDFQTLKDFLAKEIEDDV